MSKKEMIDAIAVASGVTKKDTLAVLDALASTVTSELIDGNDVTLHGIGKFVVTDKAARTARNPRTGETVQVAASKAVKFKPAGTLKASVQ